MKSTTLPSVLVSAALAATLAAGATQTPARSAAPAAPGHFAPLCPDPRTPI